MAKKQSISERFWSKVEVRGPEDCWIWKAAFFKHSGLPTYGALYIGKNHIGAHRASWTINRGAIPDGLFVLHRCDVMACVNPDHLFLGTQADNRHDCMAKGRSPRGETCGRAKLTIVQVKAIRTDPRNHTEVGNAYSVDRTTIARIRAGRTWFHQ